MAECRALSVSFDGPKCSCADGICALGFSHGLISGKSARAAERLVDDVHRKDAALDAAIAALDHLSKTGSLRRDTREETIKLLREARNERLF